VAQRQPLSAEWRNSFIAALLGWTMDAFDYFVAVLVTVAVLALVGRDATGIPLGADHSPAAAAPFV
jgi:hypothetical protein